MLGDHACRLMRVAIFQHLRGITLNLKIKADSRRLSTSGSNVAFWTRRRRRNHRYSKIMEAKPVPTLESRQGVRVAIEGCVSYNFIIHYRIILSLT